MNSSSATTTRDPAGSTSATWPRSSEVVAPMDTSPTSTPTSRANADREARTAPSQVSHARLPCCQSRIALVVALTTGRGGNPWLAVLR